MALKAAARQKVDVYIDLLTCLQLIGHQCACVCAEGMKGNGMGGSIEEKSKESQTQVR